MELKEGGVDVGTLLGEDMRQQLYRKEVGGWRPLDATLRRAALHCAALRYAALCCTSRLCTEQGDAVQQRAVCGVWLDLQVVGGGMASCPPAHRCCDHHCDPPGPTVPLLTLPAHPPARPQTLPPPAGAGPPDRRHRQL